MPNCHLLFVMGTSLTVHPAADLPDQVTSTTRRVLVNNELVGDFDVDPAQWTSTASSTASRDPPDAKSSDEPSRDFFLQGECDARILDLIVELGWLEDLREFADQMCEESRKKLERIQLEQIQAR